MNVPQGNTAPNNLRGWWASPPRSGMRRVISPWEYRHLRASAGIRFATAAWLVGLGGVTLVKGSYSAKAAGWAAMFVATAGLHVSWACWDLAMARSESNRP